MTSALAFVVGVLFAAGVYMTLRRSFIKLLIGIGLLSHAVNLLILLAGHNRADAAPPLFSADKVIPANYADPLPQALILTAIVISFGVTAFAFALGYRAYRAMDSDDLDKMTSSES